MTSGEPPTRHDTYALVRCQDMHCRLGLYCKREPDSGKHFLLMANHMRNLAKHVDEEITL
jgi:hypothetical protein